MRAQEGSLDENIDSVCSRLKNSLTIAKNALDLDQIDSVLFLTQTVQSDSGQGLKTAGHIECFQLTRDPTDLGQFILHEANSSFIPKGTYLVSELDALQNNDTIKYVLEQAKSAGYDISTIKRQTVYRQASNQGCGICALQTAIDSTMNGIPITELPFADCSEKCNTLLCNTEIELRLKQMDYLFDSNIPDVQDQLMMGKATQYINLVNNDGHCYPPTGAMVRASLLHQRALYKSPRSLASQSFFPNDDRNIQNNKIIEKCQEYCNAYIDHLKKTGGSNTDKYTLALNLQSNLAASVDNEKLSDKIRACAELLADNQRILATRRDSCTVDFLKYCTIIIPLVRLIKWSLNWSITEGDRLRSKITSELTTLENDLMNQAQNADVSVQNHRSSPKK